MGLSTRNFGGSASITSPDITDQPSMPMGSVMEYPISYFARASAGLSPDTSLSDVVEVLRTGAYRLLPIVSPSGTLLGQITEADIVLRLSRLSSAEQTRLLHRPVSDVMLPVEERVAASLTVGEALNHLRTTGKDALVITAENDRFIGVVGAADFYRQLVRPIRPPQLGGLATPIGVFLTNGDVVGGVGAGALILAGFAFCAVHSVAYFLTTPLLPYIFYVPMNLRMSATLLMQTLIQVGLLFTLVRFSPMAGFHAAEHQVVHAIERGEPLTVEAVREMPRVHPRCGTNLVAGALTATLLGIVLQPFIGSFGFLVGGATALAFWRDIGAWLQRYITTRRATDRQLENGIRAAQQVLERVNARQFREAKPLRRLWNMGFIPMIVGFLLGCGVLALASLWFPVLREPLRAYLLSW